MKKIAALLFISTLSFVSTKCGKAQNTQNDTLICKYDEVTPYHEEFAAVKLNNKWGFIDKEGKEITPIKYDNVTRFGKNMAHVELNQKHGFINTDGKKIIPLKYSNVTSFFEGIEYVQINEKYGFIDKTGNLIIENKYGYIDRTGKTVTPVIMMQQQNFKTDSPLYYTITNGV